MMRAQRSGPASQQQTHRVLDAKRGASIKQKSHAVRLAILRRAVERSLAVHLPNAPAGRSGGPNSIHFLSCTVARTTLSSQRESGVDAGVGASHKAGVCAP